MLSSEKTLVANQRFPIPPSVLCHGCPQDALPCVCVLGIVIHFLCCQSELHKKPEHVRLVLWLPLFPIPSGIKANVLHRVYKRGVCG